MQESLCFLYHSCKMKLNSKVNSYKSAGNFWHLDDCTINWLNINQTWSNIYTSHLPCLTQICYNTTDVYTLFRTHLSILPQIYPQVTCIVLACVIHTIPIALTCIGCVYVWCTLELIEVVSLTSHQPSSGR